MPTIEKEICIDCGCSISKELATCRIGFFKIQEPIRRCNTCAYANFFRDQICCAKPFKEPFPRGKLDGTAPEVFLKFREENKEAVHE